MCEPLFSSGPFWEAGDHEASRSPTLLGIAQPISVVAECSRRILHPERSTLGEPPLRSNVIIGAKLV